MSREHEGEDRTEALVDSDLDQVSGGTLANKDVTRRDGTSPDRTRVAGDGDAKGVFEHVTVKC